MEKLNFEKEWVIVTGASSGLGREIALYLSKVEQANLILIARRKEKLEQLKIQIETSTNSLVEFFIMDLSKDNAGLDLFNQITLKCNIYAIINNAGLTAYEPASFMNFETYKKMINLNYKTVIETSLLFLDYFKEKKSGGILNIGSMAGVIPTPYQTVYSSTKHGISGFTLALIAENKGKVPVISLFLPGGIKTEMVKMSGLEDKFGKNNIFNMDAGIVAKKAVMAFKSGKTLAIPGFLNKIANILQRLLPKSIIIFLFEKSYRPDNKIK
jgi:short-subunit dehydrogenase